MFMPMTSAAMTSSGPEEGSIYNRNNVTCL